MTQKNDGGPAFPTPETDLDYMQKGMSLRDWFAGQALAGIYANSADDSPAGAHGKCAKEAYDAADAMLAAREGHEKLKAAEAQLRNSLSDPRVNALVSEVGKHLVTMESTGFPTRQLYGLRTALADLQKEQET